PAPVRAGPSTGSGQGSLRESKPLWRGGARWREPFDTSGRTDVVTCHTSPPAPVRAEVSKPLLATCGTWWCEPFDTSGRTDVVTCHTSPPAPVRAEVSKPLFGEVWCPVVRALRYL